MPWLGLVRVQLWCEPCPVVYGEKFEQHFYEGNKGKRCANWLGGKPDFRCNAHYDYRSATAHRPHGPFISHTTFFHSAIFCLNIHTILWEKCFELLQTWIAAEKTNEKKHFNERLPRWPIFKWKINADDQRQTLWWRVLDFFYSAWVSRKFFSIYLLKTHRWIFFYIFLEEKKGFARWNSSKTTVTHAGGRFDRNAIFFQSQQKTIRLLTSFLFFWHKSSRSALNTAHFYF